MHALKPGMHEAADMLCTAMPSRDAEKKGDGYPEVIGSGHAERRHQPQNPADDEGHKRQEAHMEAGQTDWKVEPAFVQDVPAAMDQRTR